MSEKKVDKINEFHLNKNQPAKPQIAIHELGPYLARHQENASKAHIHSFYQIIWFKKGRGKHFVDFKEYEVSDHSIFFIAKDQVHYFDDSRNYEGVLIHFNESFLVNKDSEVDFFLKFNLFNNPYQRPSCCLGGQIDHLLNDYLRQMKEELSNETEFGKEELLRSYLQSFLIQVQRRKTEFEKTEGQPNFQVDEKRLQLVKFVNLIDENYKNGLTISEYAQKMYISTRTLADLTNQILGKTPSLMIQERIILEAQRLLLHSKLNVNQIGYRLGFDDPSYFVKYFKKHLEISPSEFRKSVI